MTDSYIQLEFDKIKTILSEMCHSESAQRYAEALSGLPSNEEIDISLDIVTECQEIIKKGYSFNFEKIAEIEDILYRFQYNAYSYKEFSDIYHTVKKAIELKTVVRKEEEYFGGSPRFIELCDRLVSIPEIVFRFESIFSQEGDVLDSASPLLKQIRNKQLSLRKSILNSLERKLNDKGLENIVQDKIVTQREGRYVIPLKDGGTGTLPGIIHGYSGSRATIFVEPNDVVGQNNELHSLRRDEEEEIYRIFCDFTSRIMEDKEEILTNNEILSMIDYYFAAAKLSNLLGSNRQRVTQKQIIKLVNARHPLLIYTFKAINKVIPFDLVLGEDKRILILSGPNTGGKTITLKTIGLMVLMTMCGLPIPAGEGTEIGSFDAVFTDIDDEQSIENSLSSFSSHLEKIKTMLNKGDDKSLVLIDEIGSATDPEQGAALAQAVLEKLIKLNVIGIVTTHYTPLKVYAESSELCVNASMQFDPDKSQPTYILQVGLPGNSFALEIASQLGLDKEVLNRAEQLTGKENVELTNLITIVSQEKKELAQLKHRLESKEKLLEMKINEYSQAVSELEKDAKEIRKKAIADARDYLIVMQQKFNKELETIIKSDKEERKKKTQAVIHKIAAKQVELTQEEVELSVGELIPVKNVELGDFVWIKEFEDVGRVISKDKGGVQVDINNIFFTTSKDNLFLVPKERKEANVNRNRGQKKHDGRTLTINNAPYQQVETKTELKLLGMTFAEALPLIERFIGDGYSSGLNKIRIVHGKGTGTLRSKIRKHLKGLKIISEFYSPPPEMGGDGVTVVVFKK